MFDDIFYLRWLKGILNVLTECLIYFNALFLLYIHLCLLLCVLHGLNLMFVFTRCPQSLFFSVHLIQQFLINPDN